MKKRAKKKSKTVKKEWGREEFVKSVFSLMQEQEDKNPAIKQVHAKLSPEWKAAEALVAGILTGGDETARGGQIEKLVSMGEISARVMIDLLLKLSKEFQ